MPNQPKMSPEESNYNAAMNAFEKDPNNAGKKNAAIKAKDKLCKTKRMIHS